MPFELDFGEHAGKHNALQLLSTSYKYGGKYASSIATSIHLCLCLQPKHKDPGSTSLARRPC